MEAELILLSREHLETIFMLPSCTKVLKNWLLFRQVTDNLHYPHAEGLCKIMSKQVYENVHNSIHISSSYLGMCGHLKHFIKKLEKVVKLWKLRLKQIGICKHQYHETLDVTDLYAPPLL